MSTLQIVFNVGVSLPVGPDKAQGNRTGSRKGFAFVGLVGRGGGIERGISGLFIRAG